MSGKRFNRRLIICVIVAAMLPITSARAGSFTVDNWGLQAGVSEVSGGPVSFGMSTQPENPFLETLSGAVGTSSASTTYDILWNDTSASFRMDADLLITGVGTRPSGQSSSINRMWITPHEDMLLTVHSEYTYNLLSDGMWTSQLFSVSNYDDGGPGSIFSEARGFDSSMGGGSDTCVIDGEVVLPAGTTWSVSNHLMIRLSSGSTGRQATGSGFFDIQLTPLPEPTTAMFLLAAAIPAIARRRRKHGTSRRCAQGDAI